MKVVEIRDVHKSFPSSLGKHTVYAVKGVSIAIPEGTVYGLIGPNGSGKSTVMKMLVGLLKPDEGCCRVFGVPATATVNRREIGFLPENPYFYKFLTGEETLRFYGRLCGLSGNDLCKQTEYLLKLVGLEAAAKQRLAGYSKGMLQRIGVAQALVQKPRLLVLDEPTAGVDPIGSRIIRDIISELKHKGMTIFLCSHLLAQVQEICDRVGILYQGCLITEGKIEELTDDAQHWQITLRNPSSELLKKIQQLAGETWVKTTPAQRSLESVFIQGIRNKMREGSSVTRNEKL